MGTCARGIRFGAAWKLLLQYAQYSTI